jgi:peptidoglycan/LPS O-acetylase OafA/YrhL
LSTNRRIVELDGLRGASALTVVLAHYVGEAPHGITAFAGGWIAVDLFFVLSGFLIGSIILDKIDTPRFFKIFYGRRVVRIVPAYALWCSVILVVIALTQGHAWSDHPFKPVVYLFFLQNIVYAFWGGGGIWILPTWTVAVEERFYLILPLCLYIAGKGRRVHMLVALWLLGPLFRLAIVSKNPEAAWVLLPSRMDVLVSGVIAAVFQRKFDVKKHLQIARYVPVASIFILLIVAGLEYFDKRFLKLFIVVNPSLVSVAIASFILAIVNGAPEARRWRSPVLIYFGKISYAFYLVHQGMAGLLHGLILNATPDVETPAQIAVTILAWLLSVGVAALSWEFFEKRCLAWYREEYAPTPTPEKA